ncbi:MAG: hypothetical protein KAR79_01895 [Simkaniaceae bacterium]|nr:hypothetical protein [Simkaniaceae bacterium]
MFEALKIVLEIQELDIKMIRLMRLKMQRKNELSQIEALKTDLKEQHRLKSEEIQTLQTQADTYEKKIEDLKTQYKKLESQQAAIKKVEEFNALTREMTQVERERINIEQQTSNILDTKNSEEDILEKIKQNLKESETSSINLEKEIHASIGKINEEGLVLKIKRDTLTPKADQETLKIYERLLRNKKDRVVVPIENRTCSGCHIALTIQHENQVSKGENIVFCEHCSRIHYTQENEPASDDSKTTKRRRRRAASTS